MVKRRKNAGFSMAELLIVIAILAVMGAIAFVVIINQMRAMAKLQRDSYAKEIFVAAQNHLAMAKSQGYLGEGSNCGTKDTDVLGGDVTYPDPANPAETVTVSTKGVYFYAVHTGSSVQAEEVAEVASAGILNLMLPFGAIDDTIRSGGSYIIRYHKDAGEVLDVFYWEKEGRYSLTYEAASSGTDGDYKKFLEHREDVEYLKNYSNGSCSGAVVGWYGGEDAAKLGISDTLNKPRLSVRNSDKLYVVIEDTNPGAGGLKLLVTGNTSGACKQIHVKDPDPANPTAEPYPVKTLGNDKYLVVLDDITKAGEHFYDRFCDQQYPGKDLGDTGSYWFYPGEDVSVQAVAYNVGTLSNVAYSSKWTTNSLFAAVKADNTKKYTASITNIRHLENLDIRLSNLAFQNTTGSNGNQDGSEPVANAGGVMEFKHAVQQADLSWARFVYNISNNIISTAIGGTADPGVVTDTGTDTGTGTGTATGTGTGTATGTGTGTATGTGTGTGFYIYPHSSTGTGDRLTTEFCYYPVTLDNIADYDGTNHSIFDVKVDYTDYTAATNNELSAIGAGLFGSLTGAVAPAEEKKISNLRLVDFTVKGNQSAGALAGEIKNAVIENVVAFNSDRTFNFDYEDGFTNNKNVIIGTNAGGLIGTAESSRVSKCAAALMVRSDGNAGNAGGLIGRVTGDGAQMFVKGCYAGGHTTDADYAKLLKVDANNTPLVAEDGKTNFIQFNVEATDAAGNAGGLIGDANAAEITCCYSTCSVSGTTGAGGTAGGLAGTASGTVRYSYATGLVSEGRNLLDTEALANETDIFATNEGALFGHYGGDVANITGCYYLGIVNGRRDISGDYKYIPAIGNVDEKNLGNRISEIEKTAQTYDEFVGPENPDGQNEGWQPAIAYDRFLIKYYKGKYNLKTVKQLAALKPQNLDIGLEFEDDEVQQLNPNGQIDPDNQTDPNTQTDPAQPVKYKTLATVHFGDWPAAEILIINE